MQSSIASSNFSRSALSSIGGMAAGSMVLSCMNAFGAFRRQSGAQKDGTDASLKP
jgi:hypothetical protein